MRHKNILPTRIAGRAIAALVAVVAGALLVFSAAVAQAAPSTQRPKPFSINGTDFGKKW